MDDQIDRQRTDGLPLVFLIQINCVDKEDSILNFKPPEHFYQELRYGDGNRKNLSSLSWIGRMKALRRSAMGEPVASYFGPWVALRDCTSRGRMMLSTKITCSLKNQRCDRVLRALEECALQKPIERFRNDSWNLRSPGPINSAYYENSDHRPVFRACARQSIGE
ncbi:hypothetical protein J6590_015755 [Homalodisca vitripennis]|nr:hypothetical protein J6590_015755 [Homalodisca vitripennis]